MPPLIGKDVVINTQVSID